MVFLTRDALLGSIPITFINAKKYPQDLLYSWRCFFTLERVGGIEPLYPAWEAGVLPLNYTRKHTHWAINGKGDNNQIHCHTNKYYLKAKKNASFLLAVLPAFKNLGKPETERWLAAKSLSQSSRSLAYPDKKCRRLWINIVEFWKNENVTIENAMFRLVLVMHRQMWI